MLMTELIIITQGTPAGNKHPLWWKPRRLPQSNFQMSYRLMPKNK
nr:MAG TPA: hypothetical protein [Bacteriophage sp.]